MAELVRRAVDRVYQPWIRPTVHGYEVNVALWRRPDAAVVGRRVRPYRSRLGHALSAAAIGHSLVKVRRAARRELE